MSSIQRLPTATPTSAAQIPFNDPQNGRDAKASLSDIAVVLQQQLSTPPGGFVIQSEAPNATGFTVYIEPPVPGASVWLKLIPGGAYAAGTVVLPMPADDGQEVLITSRQAVTALTLNDGTVYGAPAGISPTTPFRLRFDGVDNTWNRVA